MSIIRTAEIPKIGKIGTNPCVRLLINSSVFAQKCKKVPKV